MKPLLDVNYWDCECVDNYIHPKAVQECLLCGANADEQPDSHRNEVIKFKENKKHVLASRDFKVALNEFCDDHYEHFNCLPIVFEYKGVVYGFDEFIKYRED